MGIRKSGSRAPTRLTTTTGYAGLRLVGEKDLTAAIAGTVEELDALRASQGPARADCVKKMTKKSTDQADDVIKDSPRFVLCF